MKVSCKTLVCSFCVVYVFFTILAVYNLYCHDGTVCFQAEQDSAIKSDVSDVKRSKILSLNSKSVDEKRNDKSTSYYQVEIWGKAAIGLYLWEHIMEGKLEHVSGQLIQKGNVTIENIVFTFRTGPGIIPSTVPTDVQFLVLVLNGRSKNKVNSAIVWLEYLPLYKSLRKVVVVLLGNEECKNDWILPYMRSRGGNIDAVFVVYDTNLIDNVEFYQWPLGVSTYRGFPTVDSLHVDLMSARPHLCNFLGTIYVNSSRQTLMEVINSSDFKNECITYARKEWQPLETEESLHNYINALLKSDLTLNPVGKNSECYRIYEAMQMGGVPVVEDIVTPGICDRSSKAPLRLLKHFNAPLIYIKDWHELPQVLLRETQLTVEEKVKRRISVSKWYEQFKKSVCSMFVHVINDKFFSK